jgi:hypothetical protein
VAGESVTGGTRLIDGAEGAEPRYRGNRQPRAGARGSCDTTCMRLTALGVAQARAAVARCYQGIPSFAERLPPSRGTTSR